MSRYDIAAEPSSEVLAENLARITQSMESAADGRHVQLVAVSKTKSPACLQRLYDIGHHRFGENYVNEIVEKAHTLPDDVEWHFIGHLQSNKVKELLEGVPRLHTIQSIDSEKLAAKVQSGCERYRTPMCSNKLKVFIQVNTSGEESKSGTTPGEATVQLAQYIHDSCPLLELAGLMTIGMLDYSSTPANFSCLMKCREEVARQIQREPEELQLSMGMSNDYINAIQMGATVVRVGSSIFGQRFYPTK